MLKIESIQNGIVIDHIPAGKGMDIYKLLELDSQKQSIALLQSVRSEKYGCKDLIKIEGLTEPERLEVLGYLNDGVTLIVIRDGKVVKKYHPDLQEESQKESASEKLKEINEAYEILSNPESKAKFDQMLSNTTISSEDFNKIANENKKLHDELNNLKYNNKSNFYNNVRQDNNHNDPSLNNLTREQRIDFERRRQEEYQKQLEYEAQMQAAREQAYHDAYIQDLKNRGYKIRYKKTPKDLFKNFIALILTLFILFLILQLPFVKSFFIDMYENNPLINTIVKIFIIKQR